MTFLKTLLILVVGWGIFIKLKLNQPFKEIDTASFSVVPMKEYVASTPGDQNLIKSYLNIPKELVCDFIRWDLKLKPDHQFELALNYGEGKPNTLGFINDGIHKSYQGQYTTEHAASIKYDILKFISDDQMIHFEAIQLNDQLLHLLNDARRLMVGNGGWSFTLNGKLSTDKTLDHEPILHNVVTWIPPAVQVVYDGRTPAEGFVRDHHFDVNSDCFKLKWRFILNRDPNTLLPTTYKFRNVINHKPADLTGTWNIIHGTADNPDALIYQIESDQPEKTMRLLVLDENVLLFLDKNNRPYIGNKDFSFTLNRKIL